MKTKIWTVIINTGKQADLECGLGEKGVSTADAYYLQRVCSLAGG
jgi:hypothetical protein